MSIIVFLTRSFHQLKISFMFKFIVFLFTVALGMAVYGSYQLLYGIEDQFTVWGLKIEPTSIQMLFLPLVMATVAGFFLYFLLPEKVGNFVGFWIIAVSAFSFFPVIFQLLHSIVYGNDVANAIAIFFAAVATIVGTLIVLSAVETRIAKLEQKKLLGNRAKDCATTKYFLIFSTALLILLCGMYFNHADFSLATMSDRLEIDMELIVKIGLSIMGGIFLLLMYFGLKEGIHPIFFRVWLYLATLTSVFIGMYIWYLFKENWNVILNLFIAVILAYGIEKSAGKKVTDTYPV